MTTTSIKKTEGEDYSKQRAVVDTVRNTIFPKSTDEELMLFFHKCQTIGVHPLSQLVHPMKFNTQDGPKVSFIVSIDLLRSRSVETGEYDGIDEPEYGDAVDFEHTDDNGTITIQVPEYCKVRVYRKDVGRPFIGIARWNEFYPGPKKGHQWRQKPYLMLAKCAEAQARRLAFPQELDKLYTAEEMDATTAMLANVEINTTKPRVTADQVTEKPSSNHTTGPGNVGIVENITYKSGKSTKGEWTKYAITISGKSYSTFDRKLADIAKECKGQKALFTFEQKGSFLNLLSLARFAEEASPAEVMDSEEFGKLIFTLALGSNLTELQINKLLQERWGFKSPEEVPADKQQEIVDFLTSIVEEDEQGA